MNTSTILLSESKIRNIAFDLIALSVITLTPALSHLLSIPLYLLEPMRIMLLISLLYTTKKNAYILSFVLPFFSFFISSHPALPKAVLISTELMLNVYLFFLLSQKLNNNFIAMFLSIVMSKFYYYAIKFLLITLGLMTGEIVSTPIYLQLIVALAISLYTFIVFRKESKLN
ncbi:MAG: hypothetical protein QHH13_09680 [Melioribacter sp.]|uniref:hypothetical protein n=1 Tax=Rosettibacter primus TaxID=3111523 RepID=UPI00247D1779|nr:hypothetical protein [Melioribacter sp.]